MRAKYIPRIDIRDRIELKNALPLRTPYVIHIDPSDVCNFHCKFCPSGNLELMKKTKGRCKKPMDLLLFKKLIDDLDEFIDPIKVIRLYKEGEPLMNPNFADMVRYAKQSKKVQKVDTTTNASLLTKERSISIIDAGLDRLNISVEGMNEEQYRDFSGVRIDFKTYVEQIAFFYEHRGNCEVNIKINGDYLTDKQEEAFYDTFGDRADGISIEHTIEYWPKFHDMKAEVNEDISLLGTAAREVQVCPYVFYEMCINSDGTHSLCRFDWNHAMLLDGHVGSPVTTKKIWDSIVLWQFQQSFLQKHRKMLTVLSCPNCGILKQGVPENLDDFASEILENM